MSAQEIDTHGWAMPFGRYKGRPITRVPAHYLIWMVGAAHDYAQFAQAELNRRGTVLPTCEVSGHAIDRASLLCLLQWQQDAHDDEGLHAWLVRLTRDALSFGTRLSSGKVLWKGMKLVIQDDCDWPVLVTIMPE